MPRDLSSVKLDRLNRLMRLLYSGRPVSKDAIMDVIGYASSRTFERDLAFLREAYDAEIRHDQTQGGYILEGRGTFILNFTLTEREILSLVSGLSMASHFLPHLAKDADDLWTKMRSSLPESLLEKGETLGRCSVVSLPVSRMDSRAFDLLVDAIGARTNVRFSYRSPYGSERATTRVVSPWGVFFQSHAWFLWGSLPKTPKGVTYRISRIKTLHVWPETPFSPPPDGMRIDDHASSGWYGYTGDADIPVEIEISPPLAEIVQETVWHPTQRFEDDEDGKTIMRAEVPDLGAVARWVMASAPYARAKSPEELVRRVGELARGIAEGHG